ncbi:MAG: twin-arginine translocase TatA/TatE family subunit [Planctomycetota bacterium]
MFGLGPMELAIVGVIAVLLFGSQLPSVARSMGKSLTEFKKGMQGITDEVSSAAYSEPADSIDYSDRQVPSGPAFDPPNQAESSDVAKSPAGETTA